MNATAKLPLSPQSIATARSIQVERDRCIEAVSAAPLNDTTIIQTTPPTNWKALKADLRKGLIEKRRLRHRTQTSALKNYVLRLRLSLPKKTRRSAIRTPLSSSLDGARCSFRLIRRSSPPSGKQGCSVKRRSRPIVACMIFPDNRRGPLMMRGTKRTRPETRARMNGCAACSGAASRVEGGMTPARQRFAKALRVAIG